MGLQMEYLPKATKDVWHNLRNQQEEKFNASLIFFRFLDGSKSFLDGSKKTIEEEMEPITKKAAVETAQKLLERRGELIGWLRNSGYCVIDWKQQLRKRMAVGLGNPSPIENGLTMDRVHGLPYIPGSALKGIAQDYALAYIYQALDAQSREEAKKSDEFVEIFGAQTPEKGYTSKSFEAKQGSVVFLDALPLLTNQEIPFEVEIMNPHYQKYYGSKGDTPPGDYLGPNPITFLVVKKEIAFHFAVVATNGCSRLNTVKEWVTSALPSIGVGGKTRVGYGIFGEPYDINGESRQE